MRYVSGTVALYDGMLQMVHPDRVVAEADLAKLPLIEPVYPLTEGLSLNQVRKAVDAALDARARSAGWQDPSLARARAVARLRATRCAACTGRPSRPTFCRKGRRGRGSPMTNCWPASLRSRWCARICAARPGRATAGDRRSCARS